MTPDLIERLEAAGWPDRELDAEIAPIMGLRIVDEGHQIGRVCYDANNHGVPLPRYTASIDAALTLVPEGWTYEGRQGPSGFPHIWTLSTIKSGDVRYTTVTGRARSTALALCIAALRAREADRG